MTGRRRASTVLDPADAIDVDPREGHPPPPDESDGVAGPLIDVGDAPLGVRNVAARVHPGWSFVLRSGSGRHPRQVKGNPRGDGTRPKIASSEPVESITLRAVAMDLAFPTVAHRVVVAWVRRERTGRWTADGAHVWTTEPAPAGPGRVWRTNPRAVSVTRAGALLAVAPDLDTTDAACSCTDPVDEGVSGG